jgi:hypothetical protein
MLSPFPAYASRRAPRMASCSSMTVWIASSRAAGFSDRTLIALHAVPRVNTMGPKWGKSLTGSATASRNAARSTDIWQRSRNGSGRKLVARLRSLSGVSDRTGRAGLASSSLDRSVTVATAIALEPQQGRGNDTQNRSGCRTTARAAMRLRQTRAEDVERAARSAEASSPTRQGNSACRCNNP